MAGLSGALTLKKTGIFSAPSTKVDVGDLNVNIRGKKTNVKLSEDEMKVILNTSGKKEDVEKALKKIKQDKDVRKYVSDVFSFIVGILVVLIVFEVPNVLGYFYLDNISPFEVAIQVLYLVILFGLLVFMSIALIF